MEESIIVSNLINFNDMRVAKRRRSVEVNEQLKATAQRLQELNLLKEEAEKEEISKLESVETQIKTIAEENDLFVGLIITKKDLVNIVDLMLTKGDAFCKIEAKVYYND
jgi:hypothetical protein